MQSIRCGRGEGRFSFLLSNVAGWLDTGIAIAASRSGAAGVLNCEAITDIAAIRNAVERVGRYAHGPFGIKLEADSPVALELLAGLPPLDCLILVTGEADEALLAKVLGLARACAKQLLVEVTCQEQAARASQWPIDGLVAKGQEAGGAVSEETTFILLQRLLRDFSLPVWAHGGVGLHTSSACYAAGAAGVLLDSQLLLLKESSLPPRVRAAVERLEGDETVTLGREFGSLYRLYRRPGIVSIEALQELERALSFKPAAEARAEWRETCRNRVNWQQAGAFMWPLGQDSAFAAPLAARFVNVSGLVGGLCESITKHVAAARLHSPLAPGSALARSQGTEFPILQGPMTRVSDAAGFAAAVAKSGGLPFLALALLRGPQVRELLAETSRVVGDRPWGVGILGFVPSDLRTEQLDVAHEFRPPFAIIAGGRPDQAASLEREGTICYLHVPAPALLELFVRDGARRFIFEGRECGGHIGPRTSFVLWESMIEVLLRSIGGGIPGEQFHVVFAGGIHDSRSAAMVAAMAAPLAEHGVRIGVLMGTAYLFTREAVEAGAIVQSFQEEAMGCSHTVVLETGPGHATRCAETPFYDTFRAAKRSLVEAGKPHEAVREELEQLNLGRLRVASKGITQNQDPSSGSRYRKVSVEDQRREGMYMIGQVAALRDRVSTVREIHEEVSAAGDDYLRALPLPAEEAPEDLGVAAPCDIAIVGMSCVLPKAPDVRTFWANLLNKVDGITEIPRERFNIDLYYDPDRKARDKIYTRWGGFIDDVPFEPLRYGIPPTALGSIDPMQLLSLIVVDRALDDAGYRKREFTRAKTSVIFGTSGGLGDLGGHYAVRASLAELISDPPPGLLEQLPEWTEDSFAGLLPNVAAGRVANRFNLGGVNFTVDAACASSMAAVYIAARELTTRSSDMVIVGGVDTVQSPFCFLCFSKAQALSPRGRCRPFDESADGIAISEGITVLVMKRLEDAERDGDRIYTVLKAVSGSSDGRGRSMTAPRREGQKLALRRAYRQAGFSPATVGLMEAHGTGTVAGDATEMGSLSEVLRDAGAAEHSCAVGSVKSLVGHTKAAAGVTGLMKIALATYHKVLPPTLHVENPNALLSEPGSPLFVSGEAQPWLPPATIPRRAGASSFGFGGTNFHAVLEEYQGDFRDPADRSAALWPAELFVWNAPSADSLKGSLDALAGKLERGAVPELHELAAALGRAAGADKSGGVRLALVASSLQDLAAKLGVVREALGAGRDCQHQPGVYLAPASRQPGRIAFLFPGQGSQSPAMMRDLALYFPEFRDGIESADRVLEGCLPRPLSSYIYPPPAFTPEKKKEQMRAITDTLVAQPALGAIEISLARLLERLGITPAMTGGHSYGEYVALCAAGVFSEETLFRLSEARGRAIKEATQNDAGIMVAAEGSADAVAAAIREIDGVTIANYNSPRQTVLAGPTRQLEALLSRLRSAGITAVQIPVACAFHSSLVAPARDRLASALAAESFASPRIAVFSNTLGARYPEKPAEISTLLSDHLVSPVRFTDEIHAMYDQGARTFVEVGPKAVLTGLVRQILNPTDAVCIQIDTSGRHGMTSLLDALAQLFVRGVPLQTEQLFRGRALARLDLDKLAAPVPSQWTVNGGYAYQGSNPPVPVHPVQIMRNVEVERIVEVPAARPANEAFNQVPSPVPTAVPRIVSDVDTLMASFHQLMGQFLQTQAAVTMAYLQGTSGVPAATQIPLAAPVALPMAMPVAVPAPPPVPVPAPQALKAASPPPPAPPLPSAPLAERRNVLADLVRIASERTGYPVEVLDVNAAIEADLGIDSIKRVEILSSFQQLCTAEEQARVQSVMEKLAPAPSLRAIAELIDEVLSTAAESAKSVVEAAAAPRDVLTDLVRIASERTGYPVEVLDVNAAIEADLGIDSIKRVEILSSFQQLCTPDEQARVQSVMEKLAPAPSLRAIAQLIDEVLGKAGEPRDLPAVPVEIPRFTFTTVDRPRRGAVRHYPGRVCLVTDDETGIAAGIVDAWTQAGEKVLLLRQCSDAPLTAAGVYSGDLKDPAVVNELVQAVRSQHGPIGALLHLLPLRAETAVPRNSLAEWRNHLQLDLKSLYALVRACETDLRKTGESGGALIAVATGRGGAFTGNGEASSAALPAHRALADFCRTVALEIPEARCRIIDLDNTDPAMILREKLLEELGSGDSILEVGLPGDRRLTPAIQNAPLQAQRLREIQSDWVCLFTGGARGITAEVARLLAERHHPTLILVGTTPLPAEEESSQTAGIADPPRLKSIVMERLRSSGAAVRPADVELLMQRLLKEREIRATLASLRQAGSRVEYHAADVRDETLFGGLIDDIYRRYGRLDVVVHGAGIIEDKLIRDKVPESFDRVVHTKADSCCILAQKLRPESLQCLMLMSSVTAAFGNRGQADYGAANGVLNGFAMRLAKTWPGSVVAVNWGPWDQANMVSEHVRRQFVSGGVQIIPLAAGAEAAVREIESGGEQDSVVVLGGGPWQEKTLPARPLQRVSTAGTL